MDYLRLGATDLTVSELGMGCSRIGGIFSQLSERDTIQLLHAALDHGITFYDTADMYSQGESERLLGKAFGARRDRVFIASKVGYRLPSQRLLMDRLKPMVRPIIRKLGLTRSRVPVGVRGALAQDFSPTAIIKGIEGSLKRLQSDYVDLYLLHGLPSEGFDESLDCLDAQQRRGTLRYYGVSCEEAADVDTCLAHPGVSVLQLQLSLLHQETAAIAPLLKERGVGLVARQCFASGLLSNAVSASRFEGQPGERLAQAKAFEGLAHRLGRPLPELALKYSTDSCEEHVSLVGIRTREQLESAVELWERPPLTWTELSAIKGLSAVVEESASPTS